MTYEGKDTQGNEYRLHIDENDAQYAFVYVRRPDDQAKWTFALQLEWVRDD